MFKMNAQKYAGLSETKGKVWAAGKNTGKELSVIRRSRRTGMARGSPLSTQ